MSLTGGKGERGKGKGEEGKGKRERGKGKGGKGKGEVQAFPDFYLTPLTPWIPDAV